MARQIIGIVSSSVADKTAVISVRTKKPHPIYKKTYISSKKIMAHDENNQSSVGDKVLIVETKPISKRKRFFVKEVLVKAKLSQNDKAAIQTEDTASKPDSKKSSKEDEK